MDATRITQVREGPLFLEVITWHAGEVDRWTWRPDGGFRVAGAVGSSSCPPSALVAAGGSMHVLVGEAGGVRLRSAAAATYPDLTWWDGPLLECDGDPLAVDLADRNGALSAMVVTARSAEIRGFAPDGPVRPLGGGWRSALFAPGGDAALGLGTDASVRGVDVRPAGPFDAVAAVGSTLDGGTLEVVVRRDAELLHARIREGAEAPLVPLRG